MDIQSTAAHNATATLTATTPSPQQSVEQKEIVQAIKAVNKAGLFGEDDELTFQMDRETRRPVVRLVNRKTKEVIRQIPPEYVLRMAEDLKRANRPHRSDIYAEGE
ncbi:MAG: flagellar protein FlaG [Acidobacteria bacterium]|nr:flagellar protein FlaG [Acidobacteriota bacterium]